MSRPPRLNIAGIPQHIVQRGNNRQACFKSTSDYELYLALLGVACRKHECDIHAYVLMTNHVHILLTPNNPEGASLVFRDLGRDYVRQFNRKYKRTGTLWEGRFKSSLVDTNNYLLACYRYIELNPVRANLVSSPSGYPWSSYGTNALGELSDLLTPHDLWPALGTDDIKRRSAYSSQFKKPLPEEPMEMIRYGVNKGIPTGNNRFKMSIEGALSVKIGDGKRGRPRTVPNKCIRPHLCSNIGRILVLVCCQTAALHHQRTCLRKTIPQAIDCNESAAGCLSPWGQVSA